MGGSAVPALRSFFRLMEARQCQPVVLEEALRPLEQAF